jgi:four helix bundle protein
MTNSRNLAENSKQTKNQLLEQRMLKFAAEVIRAIAKSKSLPRSVGDQLTRSAASVGANYAEACNAVSKLDFRNKIFIAKKEAAESRYWIDLCIELTSETTWSILRQEVQELLLILQTIVNTLKGGSAK